VNEKIRENRRLTFSQWQNDIAAMMRWRQPCSIGSKRWQQTSLTRRYRNLCPNMTNVSVWVVIMSRSI
jgi:hypothetical protein